MVWKEEADPLKLRVQSYVPGRSTEDILQNFNDTAKVHFGSNPVFSVVSIKAPLIRKLAGRPAYLLSWHCELAMKGCLLISVLLTPSNLSAVQKGIFGSGGGAG